MCILTDINQLCLIIAPKISRIVTTSVIRVLISNIFCVIRDALDQFFYGFFLAIFLNDFETYCIYVRTYKYLKSYMLCGANPFNRTSYSFNIINFYFLRIIISLCSKLLLINYRIKFVRRLYLQLLLIYLRIITVT